MYEYLEQRARARHENESASQILAVVDFTAVPLYVAESLLTGGAEKGNGGGGGGKSQILCTY